MSFVKSRRFLFELGEVLDSTNHLRSVTILVVVPRNDLNLAVAVFHRCNHSLSCVEDRTEAAADDIGRNDLVGVVAEGFGCCCFHCCVDAFNGDVTFDDCNENGGRTGGSGNALCRTDEFAVELGDNESDCYCSDGAVGDEVD